MNLALCGKMEVLKGLLERWRVKREKALVFSRNVRMLDILQAAQDRAYRIGQTKDVHVYRLVTMGTIEEMIYARQHMADTTLEGKSMPRYFEAIQGVKSQQGELFGVRNLLQFQPQGVMKAIQDRRAMAETNEEAEADQVMMVDNVLELRAASGQASGGDEEWPVVEELALSQAIPSKKQVPPKKVFNLYVPQYLQQPKE
ncbi:hypothetical protein DYB38_011210 [Aphanomyces astaci]|uniref:Helicase C-terminal domain-containing protein n=1 Tax=Aphanomyces astaci TaxID=112090 RepID=A0A397BY39_APHAT|nr:hypothetical protein DYB36_008830 [Aphanomyces astaci]RHY35954.1 hypothetical protein DYB38_011210 [Aphanomyces astaci]RHY92393.1 hypothetical protein DYB31_009866 [Aphanomyces astaci]